MLLIRNLNIDLRVTIPINELKSKPPYDLSRFTHLLIFNAK
jgi:hypothetical protein